ncbi:hypothetical protein A9W98_17920 [Mycobacterium gordonae]|uniref:Uncharacterized protein n=1 Tax=Mycobacterium gordonae TaxID=1778 RepID=A0A1A6BHN1_MYCGO|nr:hypothetical protein [Mycobacterium gordonae]OBS01862.1 hypothetical protein A9W98_17920 [Mycobacterium gordonae]
MRFRDIRAGVTGGNPVPSHLAAATTPARTKSTAIKHPPAWYGARHQMARDQANQQPNRSRRQRQTRKRRVGRWK